MFGKMDRLSGLKENVIIGKLIPARCKASKEATEEMEHKLAHKETPHLLSAFAEEEATVSGSEDADVAEMSEALLNDDNVDDFTNFLLDDGDDEEEKPEF
jgi:hypothetical protein